MLSIVSKLLGTGMLALHCRNHRLKLFLYELGLDCANLFLFFVDMKSLTIFSVFSINNSKALLKIVLVDFHLTQMHINDLHGMLASRREGHNVIPML